MQNTTSKDVIRLEPMRKFRQTQNGNVKGQGTIIHAQITHSICQSSPLIHNPCNAGGVVGNESPTQPQKKSLYENNGVAACSHNRALCIATIVFALLFTIAIVIAFTGPQSDCTCAGEKPPHYVDEETNMTRTFIPRATNGQIFPWNNVRLPPNLRPTRYNITIHPNLTTLEVRGQISIEFYAEKETNFIVLHSHNLTILDKMIQDRRHNLTIMRMLEYTGAQQLYIEIKERLKKKHNYTMKIRFNTKLSRSPEGFYLSRYMNSDGELRFLAASNFYPTHARTVFPCFDEPHFKAKFRLTIFRDRFHIALFNTPVINTDDLGFYMGTGLLRDEFQETPEMSTYLVAFVVCDYSTVRNQTEKGISVSVYTPPPFMAQAKYALTTATHILNFFEEFFGIAYPLPKLDLVAIPDFPAGARENWGLITYRETAILSDPNELSTSSNQWITAVIAHQLAHQWFGNLVTMKWWNDLWLNEAFTTYLEYLGVDNYFPQWKMMEQFVIDKTQPALALDALSSSHPISVEVYDPNDIEVIFDTISYSKGASILQMLSKFLQQETLENGLNDFLQTYRCTNAETKELWDVFSRNTNSTLNVKAIMETWTNQMGFPLISLKREGNEILATQERFLLTAIENIETHGNNTNVTSPRLHPKSKYDYKWYVPLTYFTDNKTAGAKTVWMNLTEVRFEINPDMKWIKANVNQSGFYRVMYDNDMWKSLISILKNNHTTFNAADRASLIDDAFTLCRAGLLNASIPLELSTYLIKERDYVPWATAIYHLQNWTTRLSESLSYKQFLTYMRYLLKPIAQYVGWKQDGSHIDKLLRKGVLSAATLAELNETVAEAKQKFQNWMQKNESINPNLKEVVYSAGIKYGEMTEWNHCWNFYKNTSSASEKKILLKALGVASDPWLLQRYLMETLDRSVIDPQDVKIAITGVASNPEGRLLAWRHLKAYWPTMYMMFGNATFMMGELISAVTAHLSTPYDYYEVSTYFNGMNVGSASRALEQSLEIIKLNIQWVKKNERDIYLWLEKSIK